MPMSNSTLLRANRSSGNRHHRVGSGMTSSSSASSNSNNNVDRNRDNREQPKEEFNEHQSNRLQIPNSKFYTLF